MKHYLCHKHRKSCTQLYLSIYPKHEHLHQTKSLHQNHTVRKVDNMSNISCELRPLHSTYEYVTLPVSSAVCMLVCRHDTRQPDRRAVPERVWNAWQANISYQCLQSYPDDISRRTICHWTAWIPRPHRRYIISTP